MPASYVVEFYDCVPGCRMSWPHAKNYESAGHVLNVEAVLMITTIIFMQVIMLSKIIITCLLTRKNCFLSIINHNQEHTHAYEKYFCS